MAITLEEKRARNREWMRKYNATPEGKAAAQRYQLRYRASPSGRAKRQELNRKWKKSEHGKKYNRDWARERYVPSKRALLSPEERKARNKASTQRSINRPGYKEKRRLTAWRGHLKRTYGITPEAYQAMAVHGCQICSAPDTLQKRLHVDHSHETGKVRGLLCDPCNRGLGCFRDNPESLARAIAYLKGA